MKLLEKITWVSVLALTACRATPDYSRPLGMDQAALIPLEEGEDHPDWREGWDNRHELLPALERSLGWTSGNYSKQFFPIAGITHARALASLQRLREVLESSPDRDAFAAAIDEEFIVYKSAGWNGEGGGVLFTGYCTPELEGRLTRQGDFVHPLYGLPDDLEKGPRGEILGWRTSFGLIDYPSRQAIEAHALLADRDLELVWLDDPIDAYIAHVNGSAFVRLGDGELFRLGYAGKNGRPYTSLGRELVEAGQLAEGEVTLQGIRSWAARSTPEKVTDFLHRNESYVFFTPIDGNPRGSLNVEVQGGRSLATDKKLFPPGAAVFVDCRTGTGEPFSQFMLDQDTGGAIRTAGRADVYLGIGDAAEREAGRFQSAGQLYYFFLRPERI